MRLKNKVAILTGGASGIGQATCELFAEQGASVIVADIDSKGGEETVNKIKATGGEAIFVKTDVSKESDVANMVQTALDNYGVVNILVNDAAAFVFGKIEDVTDDDWKRVMGVNVMGCAYSVKHVVPSMRAAGGGSIVNFGSVSSLIAQEGFIPYSTTKGAILQLTRCLALDLSPHQIRVNCICPGAVLTPATERHREFIGADQDEFLENSAGWSFLNRIAAPREIAYGALFLASDEASFVTGTSLVMDGGGTAR